MINEFPMEEIVSAHDQAPPELVVPEVLPSLYDYDLQCRKFKELLGGHKKIIIAHHVDADGLASAAYGARLHQKLSSQVGMAFEDTAEFLSINNGPRSFDDQQMQKIAELKNSGFTLVVFVDLSPRKMEQLQALTDLGLQVSCVDHHIPKNADMPVEALVNPTLSSGFTDATNYSTSRVLEDISGVDPDLIWLAIFGNYGDSGEHYKKETFTRPVWEHGLYRIFSQDVNILGLAEKNNDTPFDRDQYLQGLLQLFLESNDINEFYERFWSVDAYNDRLHELQRVRSNILDFLRLADEVKNREKFPRISMIEDEVGEKLILIEQPTYRYLIYVIDTDTIAVQNIVVADIMKRHLYEQEKKSKFGPGSPWYKPMTCLLAQKKNDGYELALYSTDNHIIRSDEFSCKQQIQECAEIYGRGSGGGHERRAGADIAGGTLGAVFLHIFQNQTEFLDSQEWDALENDLSQPFPRLAGMGQSVGDLILEMYS